MNILILGSGGREHALAWAVQQNPKCDRLIVAPGNAGIAAMAECAALDIEDGGAVAEFCADNAVDFVIVGPEAPLAAGVADRLREAGVLTFGPSQAAARLEASKSFTKEICDAAGAPTAAYARFTDAEAAKAYIRAEGAPIVVKADGLAAGRGVIVAMEEAEALAAIDDMFDGAFGSAGAEVVIEEFMTGEEASFFVLCDGENLLPIGTAQDHKRVGDGDTGPNTGGMGAYSPAPVLSDEIAQKTMDEIVGPTMRVMAERGTPFQGVLFVGLMIENGQPRLVEYNVRFGDPECQVLMMRLGAQVLDLLLASAEGRLGEAQVNWAADHALSVVMAANGYPGAYKKGSVIGGLDGVPEDSKHMVFHAGTTLADGKITATGGRVLNVTARGASLAEARDAAYAMVDQIDWPEGFCRRDIGWRALGVSGTRTYRFRPALLHKNAEFVLVGPVLHLADGSAFDLTHTAGAAYITHSFRGSQTMRLDLVADDGRRERISYSGSARGWTKDPDALTFLELARDTLFVLSDARPDTEVLLGEYGRTRILWFALGLASMLLGAGLIGLMIATGVSGQRLIDAALPLALVLGLGGVISYANRPGRLPPSDTAENTGEAIEAVLDALYSDRDA